MAAAWGSADVIVTDCGEEVMTSVWQGDPLRVLLVAELDRITDYLASDNLFQSDAERVAEIGNIFLFEKAKLLKKCLSKLCSD